MSSSNSAGQLLIDEPAPHVARLTISNPGKRGALDQPLLDAFAATMPELDARCVIITGEGRLAPEVERELLQLRRSRFSSEDFREGVRAFVETPPPDRQGR